MHHVGRCLEKIGFVKWAHGQQLKPSRAPASAFDHNIACGFTRADIEARALRNRDAIEVARAYVDAAQFRQVQARIQQLRIRLQPIRNNTRQ